MAFASPPPHFDISRVRQVPRLGTLMMLQGAAQLLWFVACLVGVAVGALNALVVPGLAIEGGVIGGLYALFALGALPPAVLWLLSGLRVRFYRSRRLAFWALGLGLVSVLCGNVFCAPTAIPLAIYGFVLLLDVDVRRAFERVERGGRADPIEALVRRDGFR